MYDFCVRQDQLDHSDQLEIIRHFVSYESGGVRTTPDRTDVIATGIGKLADICLVDVVGKCIATDRFKIGFDNLLQLIKFISIN